MIKLVDKREEAELKAGDIVELAGSRRLMMIIRNKEERFELLGLDSMRVETSSYSTIEELRRCTYTFTKVSDNIEIVIK